MKNLRIDSSILHTINDHPSDKNAISLGMDWKGTDESLITNLHLFGYFNVYLLFFTSFKDFLDTFIV